MLLHESLKSRIIATLTHLMELLKNTQKHPLIFQTTWPNWSESHKMISSVDVPTWLCPSNWFANPDNPRSFFFTKTCDYLVEIVHFCKTSDTLRLIDERSSAGSVHLRSPSLFWQSIRLSLSSVTNQNLLEHTDKNVRSKTTQIRDAFGPGLK